MGQELGADVVRARKLARELQASEAEVRERERRMSLAAKAAELALWTWDIPGDVIWITPGGRVLYGIEDGAAVDLAVFLGTLHEDDRERVRLLIEETLAGSGEYETEYRIVRPDGRTRWIAARGAVERGPGGSPARIYGVSLDITPLKDAERELLQQHGRARAPLPRLDDRRAVGIARPRAEPAPHGDPQQRAGRPAPPGPERARRGRGRARS